MLPRPAAQRRGGPVRNARPRSHHRSEGLRSSGVDSDQHAVSRLRHSADHRACWRPDPEEEEGEEEEEEEEGSWGLLCSVLAKGGVGPGALALAPSPGGLCTWKGPVSTARNSERRQVHCPTPGVPVGLAGSCGAGALGMLLAWDRDPRHLLVGSWTWYPGSTAREQGLCAVSRVGGEGQS